MDAKTWALDGMDWKFDMELLVNFIRQKKDILILQALQMLWPKELETVELRYTEIIE